MDVRNNERVKVPTGDIVNWFGVEDSSMKVGKAEVCVEGFLCI